MRQLIGIFKESTLYLMPSRMECAAIAFCEASKFGLPSLTTDAGGITSFVKNGINGYTLPISASADDFVNKIIEVLSDKKGYSDLRASSRKYYKEKLNWEAWLDNVLLSATPYINKNYA